MGPRVRGDDAEFGKAQQPNIPAKSPASLPGNASIKARERVKIVVD